MLTVREIDDERSFREFLDLPKRVYRNDPVWVPALDAEVRRSLDRIHNPYFRTAQLGLFGCWRDERLVARVCAVVHPDYRTTDGAWPALFGFFEAEEDVEAVRYLFDNVAAWCRARGATSLQGPFHPHHYSEIGLQITGFDRPVTFFQTHHPSSYRGLLEQAGFSIGHTVQTHRNPDIRKYLASQHHVSTDVPGLRIRPVDLRDLKNELARIREVYNDAFADNAFFLPVSLDEYLYSCASLRLVTRPDLNVIVEHGDEPVGVLQCMLDVNPLLRPIRSGRPSIVDRLRFLAGRRKLRTLVVYAVGIKKHYQRGRAHVLLFNALRRMAADFDALETTWISPDNPLAMRAAEKFGMEKDKEFVILRKNLGSDAGGRTGG